MPAPVTEHFHQMTLETSTNGSTWTRPCGLVGVTINRSAAFDTSEVPADCVDESLPLRVERSVRSIDVTVSADGVWSQQSYAEMSNWFYSGATRHVRIGHLATLTGDPQYEQGLAFLTSFNNVRQKGQKVAVSIEIAFDGTPSRVNRA